MTRTTATATRKPRTTSAIALLKRDHVNARRLLRQLEKTEASETEQRKSLLEQVAREIGVHAQIEEEIFYPAFHEAAQKSKDEMLFFEAAEEHGLVHRALPELEGTDPGSELFSARAKVLKDLIEHHAEEEENQMFPRAQKLLDASELRELGQQLQERKDELMNGEGGGRRSS